MKAAVLKGIRNFDIENISYPETGTKEILIRVKVCSICGSDLRTFNHGNDRVKFPAVIGHEMSGEIVELGKDVKNFNVGDRVCVGADIPSMEDEWSKKGMPNLSDINYAIGYQFQGGYAEYCLLNELTVKYGPFAKIPDHISYEEASLTEPLACCINGLERIFLEPGMSVLVIGAGPIGILLSRAAKAFGAGLVVVADSNQGRVLGAKSLGLKSFNSKNIDLQKKTNNLTKGKGFNAVITACSVPEVQEISINLVSKRGVINFFGGLPVQSRGINFDSNIIHYKEAYITGSHGSNPRQFNLALQMIASGQINVKDLISHRFDLTEIKKAFETAEKKDGLKVSIIPNNTN